MEESVQSYRETKSSTLAIITNPKLINIVCTIIIISSAFMIYRRVVFNWTHSQAQVDFVSYLHGFSMGIPFYFLILTYFVLWFPKVRFINWLNKITDIKILAPTFFIGIILTIVFLIFKLPAPLGTWTSVGLLLASILMCCSLLRNKVPQVLAFTIAVGITGMWVGFWEIPYQIALKLVYDLPQVGTDMTIRWIAWEIILETPMAGCGLWLVIIANQKYHFIRFSKVFYGLMSLYAVLTIIWITSGFWVDVWYNWKENIWVATQNWDKWSMFIYKSSKAIMLLGFISLIWNKKYVK